MKVDSFLTHAKQSYQNAFSSLNSIESTVLRDIQDSKNDKIAYLQIENEQKLHKIKNLEESLKRIENEWFQTNEDESEYSPLNLLKKSKLEKLKKLIVGIKYFQLFDEKSKNELKIASNVF